MWTQNADLGQQEETAAAQAGRQSEARLRSALRKLNWTRVATLAESLLRNGRTLNEMAKAWGPLRASDKAYNKAIGALIATSREDFYVLYRCLHRAGVFTALDAYRTVAQDLGFSLEAALEREMPLIRQLGFSDDSIGAIGTAIRGLGCSYLEDSKLKLNAEFRRTMEALAGVDVGETSASGQRDVLSIIMAVAQIAGGAGLFVGNLGSYYTSAGTLLSALGAYSSCVASFGTIVSGVRDLRTQ